MFHSNHISTDTIVQHDTGQMDRLRHVFGSGNSLSREAFDALWRPTAPRGVEFFKILMRSAIELEAERASLLSTISRTTVPAPAALRHHWLHAHALGHLALLAFRDDTGWFAEMLHEVNVNRWTPTHALIRERIMSVALRGAWAAGQLGEAALGLYLPLLRSPAEPLQHFDAVLAVAMVCLKNPHLAPLARPSLEQWASRANAGGQYRRELMDSVAFLLDDPDGARIWSACWSRRVLSLHGDRDEQSLVSEAGNFGTSESELLLLAALNDVSDCGVFLGGLSPAVLLLSHLRDRNPDEFYAPARAIPILAQTWTPELSLDVLGRSLSATVARRAFDA
jgi:hypothetical protein